MKLSRVRLSNVFGIESLEFEAGTFNEIAGDNGLGKTSVLNAIRAGLEGGSDATLLRQGAEKGEVVLVFDDRTTVTKRVTPKTTTLTVEKDGVREKEPQKALNLLFDRLSVNPVSFLLAEDKKRVDVLLQSLPMKADPDRIREIMGATEYQVDADLPALGQIEAAYKEVFDDRRMTNRAHTEKEAAINQLAQTLPKDGEAGAGGESEDDLRAKLKEVDDAQEAEMKRIDDKLGAYKTASETKIDEWREEIARLNALVAAERESLASTTARAEGQRSISTGRWRDNRQPFVDALNLLDANRSAAQRAEQTRSTLRTLRADADKLKDDSERMTAALRKLEAYKAELLDSLPIPGLVVEDGVVSRNGIVFDRLNEAQQVEIAFEIAKLRAGDMKVVCVDGIEKLSETTYAAFKERAMASGLQLFVTRVSSDDSLQITQA